MAALFDSFQGNPGFIGPTKRRSSDSCDVPMKKRRETRGDKEIEGQIHFRKMDGATQIGFLDKVYDDDHTSYCNEDRQFLLRANATVTCYRACCKKDPAKFQSKHGIEKAKGWTFHLAKWRRCPECEKCETDCGSFKMQAHFAIQRQRFSSGTWLIHIVEFICHQAGSLY